MRVQIYILKDGDDVLAGELVLDGDRVTIAPESPMLARIRDDAIYDPQTQQVWNAQDNPQEFLRALPGHLRSPYLRAILADDGRAVDKADKSEKNKHDWRQQQKALVESWTK